MSYKKIVDAIYRFGRELLEPVEDSFCAVQSRIHIIIQTIE